jgi:hypothetical protein
MRLINKTDLFNRKKNDIKPKKLLFKRSKNSKATTCIVTSYYNIKSKFPKEQYLEWINNFMNNVSINVFIYTSVEMKDYFESFKKPNIKIIVEEFKDLYYYKYYDIFVKQNELDETKNIRTPELYILWYNKLKFVEKTSINYPKYNNYIWCDIGVFRNNNLFNRHKYFGHELEHLNVVNLLCLREPKDTDMKLYEDNIYGQMNQEDCFIGGGIIGIPANKINQLIELQNNVFNKLIVSDRFFGCDQRCYAYMYAEKSNLFKLIRPSSNYNDDVWFYLLDYFNKIKL